MLIVILLLLFAVLLQGARHNAYTFDEPSHLAAGYAFLQQGLSGLWTVPLRGHPLLFNAWEALPVFISDSKIQVLSMQGWGTDRRAFTTEFIHNVRNLPAAKMSSRLPSILCAVLLVAVLWRGTTDIWNKSAGFLAVLILCFDPLFLAHSRLSTNDVAVTAFGGLYLYVSWRWSKKPSWRRALMLGLLLGVTMLTKATGILFGAVGLLWSLWVALRFKNRFTSIRYPLWLQVLVIGSIALGIIWSAYGFSFGPTPMLPSLPVPAPVHWQGVFFQAENAVKREVFAFGYKKIGRWWWYFLFALVVKNPLPLLLALPFSIFVFLKWRRTTYSNRPKQGRTLKDLRFAGIMLPLFFGLSYIGAALFIGPNVGYRHFLPVQPVFCLFISGALNLAHTHLKKWMRLFLVGLGGWYILGTACIYPHEISFFNELVGGPDQGWRYLTTSNTDWLQGWNDLYQWQQETGIHFNYAGPEGYLGLVDYDIAFSPLPPVKGAVGERFTPWLFPPPGDYIIGASILSGMNIFDEDNYSWFRYHQPDDIIAHSLYYYEISSEEAPVWVAQCNIPATPLDEIAVKQGYGERNLRLLSFDCTKSWIYPDSGQSFGHYVLQGSLLTPETWRTRLHVASPRPTDPFTEKQLQNAPMAVRERYTHTSPPFGVYSWSPQKLNTGHQTTYAAPVTTVPQDLTERFTPTTLPTLNDSLTFLGIEHNERAGTLEVETWWRVNKGAIPRPLSIMAHLLTLDGKTLEVADGLNAPSLIWQNNDIVVQQHSFSVSCETTEDLWLRTGVYWLDSLERWKVEQTDADALFLALCDTP